MRFRFRDKKLEAMYYEGKVVKKYIALQEDFITVVDGIEAAPDERDFYELRSLRFEKLKGKLKGKRSLRLNDQYRLIVSLETDEKGKYVLIWQIDDYH